MRRLILISTMLYCGILFGQNPGNEIKEVRSFFGKDDPLDGFERASPSFTSDGKTMVYVRYTDWMQKVPYIADWKEGKWESKQLDFVNYVYNLAISPDGNRIIYKKYWPEDQDEISKTFVVDKQSGYWGNPKEVKTLYDMNAGYFNFTPDGTLWFFGRKPKTGVYVAKPDDNTIYSKPEWVSDDISPGKPTSFDVLMHPDKNKLIVTQDTFPKEMVESRGGNGVHYFEKIDEKWTWVKRLAVPYGWGASILPDGRFVYVRNSDIYYVNLKDLEIDW